MNDTRRTRRVFQPGVESLEGRPLPSSVAGVMAPAAHVAQHQVQEQRPLRLHEQLHVEHKQGVEVRREMQTHRKEHQTEQRATVFRSVSSTNPGAMIATVGTPARTASSASSSSASTPVGGGLHVHVLAPNNLGAADTALPGMSVGMTIEETVTSAGQTAGSATNNSSSGLNSNSNSGMNSMTGSSSASSVAGSMNSGSMNSMSSMTGTSVVASISGFNTGTMTGMMTTSTSGSSVGTMGMGNTMPMF